MGLSMENKMKKLSLVLVFLVGFTSYAVPNAMDDYKKACLKQDAQGCLNLGLAYAKGIETEQDYELAKDYLDIACDLGNTQACTELKDIGQNHDDSGNLEDNQDNSTESNKIKEDDKYKKACDRGDGLACWDFGYLYYQGKEVKRNYAKAGKYYKKACDLGNGLGCFNIGYLHEEGIGVKRNYPKAVEYYRKSCNLADGTGCYLLALSYEAGKGVEHSRTKAKKYCKKACDLGNEDGCEGYREMGGN